MLSKVLSTINVTRNKINLMKRKLMSVIQQQPSVKKCNSWTLVFHVNKNFNFRHSLLYLNLIKLIIRVITIDMFACILSLLFKI